MIALVTGMVLLGGTTTLLVLRNGVTLGPDLLNTTGPCRAQDGQQFF